MKDMTRHLQSLKRLSFVGHFLEPLKVVQVQKKPKMAFLPKIRSRDCSIT